MAFHRKQQDDDTNIDIHNTGTPIRYASLDRVYSACVSSSASGSSNVMSKKVKARKLVVNPLDDPDFSKPPIVHVYTRRSNKHPHSSFFKSVLFRQPVKQEICELEDKIDVDLRVLKKRRLGSSELEKLGVDSSVLSSFSGPRLRDCRNSNKTNHFNLYSSSNGGNLKRKQRHPKTILSTSPSTKRWVRLSFDGADPKAFIGLQCKVFWPLDADWYSGCVVGCNPESKRHYVKYEDGDEEDLILSNEKIKFYISQEEIERLKLSVSSNNIDNDGYDYNEMVVLAATLDGCQEPEPGDIIWAKLTGHSMWPAVVVDESLIGDHKGLNKILGGRSVPVQFFGTHDFARINVKQVISFLKGLLSSFHLKCKKPRFTRSLEEAKMYLSEQKLPRRMLLLRNGIVANVCENTCSEDEGSSDSGEVRIIDERIQGTPGSLGTSPYVVGDLQIISLGKIVKDSEYFQDDRIMWPEGYTAIRKFISITDPSVCCSYKMEVLRDPESNIRPLFRVTLDGNKQFNGSTPSACWNKIYRKLRKKKINSSDGLSADGGVVKNYESGYDMFGFSSPEVMKLIKGLSKSRLTSKFSMCKLSSGRCRDLPAGYRPVRVDWKDLDKCSVCHMDEEYEDNLFLQCDKCRIMVHARCYGELEPVDGVLWLCNLCCPEAPESPPPCCLCPVIGGAMKPTTDGRWAHLACAIWIPETCLYDVKRMEPIDGLDRINKDRWKLLCSICGVSYGACIQCSNSTCRVAYHPLCARAAGLCVELEDEDRLNLLSFDEDDEDQCIRLLSFCKKHRQPSNERLAIDERVGQIIRRCCDYCPPSNPSGCARSEPYNNVGRRGRKEPEALAAASLKRLFVENQPYLVGRYCQHGFSENILPSIGVSGSKFSFSIHRDAHNNILSMAEKYKHMRETFRKRLAFGKSAIHGFGIFAKHPHRAGDMVIEYTGELVRPPIADRREHFIYNSLVGAGTYMFRIDDERVIDATRAGSIAHLINHSCEPNCYSRVISVNGDEHIIIFAKRDIKQWEELTYDYRFFSIDEQLSCYCGFPRCRGIVNDTEAEEPEPEPTKLPDSDPPKNEDEWEEEEEGHVSQGNGTAGQAVEEDDNKLADLKKSLVDTVYGTEFGFRAGAEVRAEVLELANQLEALNPTPRPVETAGVLDGNWVLLYTAFSELLPLLAAGATPLLKVEKISQTIDTSSLSIENSTTLSSPFATFSFSASASFEVRSPSRIQVQFKEATFQPPDIKSTVSLPENVDIFGQNVSLLPVQQSLSTLQEAAANIARAISGQPPLKIPIPGERTKSWLLITYLDEDLRISRGDGGLFVLVKEGSPLLN